MNKENLLQRTTDYDIGIIRKVKRSLKNTLGLRESIPERHNFKGSPLPETNSDLPGKEDMPVASLVGVLLWAA